MRLLITVATAATVPIFFTASLVAAQTTPKVPAESESVQLDQTNDASTSSQQALFGELEQLFKYLKSVGSYQLTLKNRWKSSQGEKSEIGNVLQLRISGADRVRLEIQEGSSGKPQLIAASDGANVTHWFVPENLYSQQAVSDAHRQIRQCSLTDDALAMCGAGFLLEPDLQKNLRARVLHINDLGVMEELRHFHLELINGEDVDLWLKDDEEKPLPVKIISRIQVATNATTTQSLTRVSEFQWQFNQLDDAAAYSVQLPDTARRVTRLQDALLGQAAEDLIGKPVPQFQLTSLDGQPAEWQSGDQPKLLYFWASWAAPSVRRIPSVEAYAAEIAKTGVSVTAVNIGEPATEVAEFAKQMGYSGTVLLDQQGQAAAQLCLTNLPAVVLVDSQGLIRASFQDVNESVRDQLNAEIQRMSK